MKTMSIKAYAVANKISIYNVVKMTQNGSLKTQLNKVDGKDEVFIIVDEVQETAPASHQTQEIEDYKKAYIKLKIKYDQLQHKYDTLQKTIPSKKVL